ncbi:GGDEF domain-containing protein [Vibrio metschnikovii]|nr:GGDEF domain-containing protein [Vibrio metschnikovii]EKO3631184.1 GGDEF domain-containing protein [Vibrio metschnikovii]EKO3661381.1 GGDEF domain-containing protein [Vibrio metschnikovii]EKO3668838.1 GGDEF domain-containing protein [Vibrio metschnikovii]EKO3727642.1 GGDEF domain-containing protein [Vibrio metschnikovii]
MKDRLFHSLSLVVFLAFLVLTSFYAWQDSRRVKHFIQHYELPSIGMALAASVDRTAGEYHRISGELQHNNFIRDWILAGEQDIDILRTFLRDISLRFRLADASIVSDRSETYYSDDQRIIKLDPNNVSRDGWYYLYRETLRDINIDTWYYAEEDKLHIWVNAPLFDHNGEFLGLTGVGVDTEDFSNLLMTYGRLKGFDVYLARLDGQLVYARNRQLLADQLNLSDLWDIEFNFLDKNRDGIALNFANRDDSEVLLWIRFMDTWNTWLVVEKSAESIQSRINESLKSSALLGGSLSLLLFLVIFASIMLARHKVDEKTLHLEYQAGTDCLTGLFNRAYLSGLIQLELTRLRKVEGVSAILLIDIDYFKRINDTYGHPIGDQVLCCVAHSLNQNIREGDAVARFGGEEFMVLLPNISLQDAVEHAEQLRLAVSELIFPCLPQGERITVSIGISLLDTTKDNPIETAYFDADRALYRAKSSGRNRVMCS